VDKETLGLSPQSLINFIETQTYYNQSTYQLFNSSTHQPITACVPVHTFGHPCRIDEIVEICDRYNLPVVEDAAESLGSLYKGQHTGTFGKIGILSFNGNKILTTGGGGLLLFQDEKLAKHAKHLTTQAKLPHPWEFVHNEIGYNYRMPNINAALGLAQLEQLDGFLATKKEIAFQYKEFFKSFDIPFITEPENASSNYWLNCILLKDKTERNEFLNYSNKNGIMVRPAWELMNKLEMFRDCQSDDLLISTELFNRLVNIPSSPFILQT
jgi:dTDP-4-amino-4,6-dideoxygalactose transaminase